MTDILLSILIVMNVIGGWSVIRWLHRNIRALEGNVAALQGTVKAQSETLETVGSLNKTALEMIRAVDPERWAKEVEVHKRLADAKATAIVDGERRKLGEVLEQAKGTREEAIRIVEPILLLALRAIGHVPKHRRREVIQAANLTPDSERDFLDFAEEAPDLSR
jgi:hypothetical protein